MGVPKLVSSFIKRLPFPNVVLNRIPDNISTLSIDMNGILHSCAQFCYAYTSEATVQRKEYVLKTPPEVLEKEYHILVTNKISEIISHIHPSEALILAVDGVCPLAKIKQQRQRRYRAAMERVGDNVFDSNSITTGTSFMSRLDTYLTKWITTNQLYLPPLVIYSNHRVKGEGEHKIMDIFRDREDLQRSTKSHAIYGLDADLILLSMIAPIRNAYLVREDVTDVINIEALKNALWSMMNRSKTAVLDFSVIMSFVGNDFLPAVVSTSDMSSALKTLMDAYRKVNKPLVTNNTLNWENLSLYLAEVASREPKMFNDLSYNLSYYPLQIVKDNVDMSVHSRHQVNMDALKLQWYNHILSPPSTSDVSVFQKLLNDESPFGMNENNFNDMITNYLIGVAWVLKYYTKGPREINMSWYYPYSHAPLFSELAESVGQMNQSFYDDLDDDTPFDIPHQLLSVLPPKSLALIPSMLQVYVTDDFSFIRDLFPDTFTVDMQGSKHGNSLVPFIDSLRIIEAVHNISFNDAQRKYYFEQGKDLVIVRTTLPQKKSQSTGPTIANPTKEYNQKRPSHPNGSPKKIWDKVLPSSRK